jgi:hypothetical protein
MGSAGREGVVGGRVDRETELLVEVKGVRREGLPRLSGSAENSTWGAEIHCEPSRTPLTDCAPSVRGLSHDRFPLSRSARSRSRLSLGAGRLLTVGAGQAAPTAVKARSVQQPTPAPGARHGGADPGRFGLSMSARSRAGSRHEYRNPLRLRPVLDPRYGWLPGLARSRHHAPCGDPCLGETSNAPRAAASLS